MNVLMQHTHLGARPAPRPGAMAIDAGRVQPAALVPAAQPRRAAAPSLPHPLHLRSPSQPRHRHHHRALRNLRTRSTASPAPAAGNGAGSFPSPSPAASVADPAASTWDVAQQPSTSAPVSGRAPGAPRRVCIFVEPSPFTYVSGYKNRFTTMIKYLVEAGCEVLVVTTGRGYTLPGVDSSSFRDQPETFAGARVVSALSFGCPWYLQVPLSFALSPRIWREVRDFRPDVIHCSSPGVMVFAAKFYAWLLKAPIVLSYHTHVPSYLPRYGIEFLVPAMWGFLRILHATAHLTLTVSPAMVDELVVNRAVDDRKQIQVWKKGVDSDTFHPRFRSAAMRARLTGGKPERPVLVYVGRLGFEKNLFFLRELLNRNPGVCLAFVGDGPARSRVGARARQEVAKWDWRAATMHLLNVQYPLAMAAAAAQYGRVLGEVARGALERQQQQPPLAPQAA
ncbi:hypothetical protein GPECTOR_3g374 [Gonium pectorale]|uniref:Glycosyltransferase subfamily 4-like N-terminal domain-containing protein n=1 Tax=Gonium pectorale TaxID=33097 RepID=A0A150GZQ3_GONPE|nr:hypothetical protein GPECTOR_3g374 [Gonium pectorale]|eukprot:KXZ55233.1 hypothetical protein GPECTOR_3g374 [Gonium pectorale]